MSESVQARKTDEMESRRKEGRQKRGEQEGRMKYLSCFLAMTRYAQRGSDDLGRCDPDLASHHRHQHMK